MQSYRPTGVTLMAILFFVLGALDVLAALTFFFIPLPDPLSSMTIIPALVAILFAALYLAVGWGLLQLKDWARTGAIVLSALALFGYLLSGILLIVGFDLGGVRIGFTGVGLGMVLLAVIPAVFLWYLFKPDIRTLFSSGGGAIDYNYPAPPLSTAPSTLPPPPPSVATSRPAPPMERTRQIDQTPRAMAWLVVQSGPYAGKQFGLADGRNIIGRDGTRSDFILDDDLISGQHAQVRFENGQFVIYDLASTNHTFVNNRQVQRQPLMDNDVVRLGSTQVVFKAVPKPRQ